MFASSNTEKDKQRRKTANAVPTFVREARDVVALISDHEKQMSDESLVKVVRELDFWYKEGRNIKKGRSINSINNRGHERMRQQQGTHDNNKNVENNDNNNDQHKQLSKDEFHALAQRLIRKATWPSRLVEANDDNKNRLLHKDHDNHNHNQGAVREDEKKQDEEITSTATNTTTIKNLQHLGYPDNFALPPTLVPKKASSATTTTSSLPSDQQQRYFVPQVRFGRTELKVSIITCGGMRLQNTWLPDFVPMLSPNRDKVLKSKSHQNLVNCVRTCLKLGINHFENARTYGSSEYEFVDALAYLMEIGEIQRKDFVFQTKIPISKEIADFQDYWQQTWDHCGKKLGYIDLLGLYGVNNDEQVNMALMEDHLIASNYKYMKKLQKKGKIKYIGFSSHGTAANIMKLIESNRFDYVNLHCHYFGSYTAEGTNDTQGYHGNLACVRRAQQMDMGIFLISPSDKGGKLYAPSSTICRTIGHHMSPIAFASLHAWKTANIHTIGCGLAKPSDLDEILEACEMYKHWDTTINKHHIINIHDASVPPGRQQQEALLPSWTESSTDEETDIEEEEKSRIVSTSSTPQQIVTYKQLYQGAKKNLDDRFEAKLGKEWVMKGMVGLPSCYEESSHGIAIGYILWLHNLLMAYGMYDFCKERYRMLETTCRWDDSKSFVSNQKTVASFNPGRPYAFAKMKKPVQYSVHGVLQEPTPPQRYVPCRVLLNFIEKQETKNSSSGGGGAGSGNSAHLPQPPDLQQALEHHYWPDKVLFKLRETHDWLAEDNAVFVTDGERTIRGWDQAYNLSTWECYPGQCNRNSNNSNMFLNFISFGLLGGGGAGGSGSKPSFTVGGPNHIWEQHANHIRAIFHRT